MNDFLTISKSASAEFIPQEGNTMPLHPRMDGQVVAIVDACDAAGAAIARLMASKGAKVMLGGHHLAETHALAAQITEAGGCVQYRAADRTRRASIDTLIDHTLDAYGRIDLLVNVGVAPTRGLATCDSIGMHPAVRAVVLGRLA